MKTIRSMKGFLCYLTGVVFVATAVLLLSGCMDPLGRESTAAAGISVMNAPSTVTELELTVSGPGMSTIQRTLTPVTSSVTLEVPVGVNRRFHIGGDVYSGERRLPVSAAGASVNVAMYPGPVFIHVEGINRRFAQIQGMGANFGRMRYFFQDGSIFDDGVIGISFGDGFSVFVGTSDPRLYRFSSFAGTSPELILDGQTTTPNFSDFRAIASDRAGGWVYGTGEVETDGLTLFRVRFDGTGFESFGPIQDFTGIGASFNFFLERMAIDSSGAVLLTGDDNGDPGRAVIVKLRPSTGSREALYVTPFVEESMFSDIVVFGNDVFVVSANAPTGYAMRRLDANLSLVESFGRVVGEPSDDMAGDFSSGVDLIFAATIPKKFVVVEGPAFSNANRLVAFENMQGSGWIARDVGSFDLIS
ncbi:MAG: hypothetical protein EA403_01755 [Spirochaetaceae bacterium]|nr:MAG: hypothetical protein EA403_01755 [Spirochaetaceae bacterium]